MSARVSPPFPSFIPTLPSPPPSPQPPPGILRHGTRMNVTLPPSPALSRRAVLLAACSLSLVPLPTFAYSSPYKPNETPDKPLPDRLYESTVPRVVTTPSGLQYFDLSLGSGPEAHIGDTAYIYYTSRLRGLNGIKIQSTYDDPNAPPCIFRIGANDVVPGVSEALTGMKVGGKRRAVLPPNIAYRTPDMVPKVTEFFPRRRLLSVLETQRDATIVFDLELIKVK